MNIEKFKESLNALNSYSNRAITRGSVLNMLSDVYDSWSNVIKALILGSNELFISVNYLLKKVNFCINNPDNPEMFLDYKRTLIFDALEFKY